MKAERHVGGLWCGEVLARLSDYVDGSLPAATRERIENHLRGCDVCERFGGHFGQVVEALRRELGAAEPMPSEAAERLARHLNARLGRE